MAHELETNEQGQARMFYAGQAPWHGLGKRVESEVTSEEALKLAQLDWEVEKRPIFTRGTAEIDGIPVIGEEIDTHQAIFRKQDNKLFGVVGAGYEIIQNHEAMSFLDTLTGEGLAMFHTAGSMFEGRRVFVSCKLPDSIQVGPDQVDKYLVALWGHDGTMAYHIKWTPIRVVCWNTASAAFGIRGGKVQATDCVTIKHTTHWRDKTDEVREILDLTNVYYTRLEECFNKLIATPMNVTEFDGFAKKLYPDEQKKGQDKPIDRSKTREQLKSNWFDGIGLDHPDVKNTRWAAWNAVTEYIDHDRKYYEGKTGGVADIRMNSVIWGQGSQIKKKALDLLAV